MPDRIVLTSILFKLPADFFDGLLGRFTFMTAAQLSEELRRMIEAGELDPNAVFITPSCMCDQDVGYVEVRFVDQVRRAFSDSLTDSGETRRMFYFGDSKDRHAIQTVKLA